VSIIPHGHLGAPSAGRWGRAEYTGIICHWSVPVERSGCYQLSLRSTGEEEVTIAVDGFLTKSIEFGPALCSGVLGRYCLPKETYAIDM